MTTQKASDRLGVSPRRVRQFIAEGRLAATKHGRDYWIEQDALEAFQAMKRNPGRPKGK